MPKKHLSRASIQRRFAKAIVRLSPSLRNRQTIRDLQSGGIVGLSLLIATVLLVVVLTVPVGGVTILGLTLFAKTLIVAWGPLALIPIAALLALGGCGAFWYKKHKDVFRELQDYLCEVIEHMESMAYAIEDIFFLYSFQLFQEDSSVLHEKKSGIRKTCDDFMTQFISEYVDSFIDRLSRVATDQCGKGDMSPESFFQFLSLHPGETQQCFQQSFSGLLIDNKNSLLQLEADIEGGS